MAKNILGEEVKILPFRIVKKVGIGYKILEFFRGEKYIGYMTLNGWNGFYNIQHKIGDGIIYQLDNFKEGISISDMKLIIKYWEED